MAKSDAGEPLDEVDELLREADDMQKRIEEWMAQVCKTWPAAQWTSLSPTSETAALDVTTLQSFLSFDTAPNSRSTSNDDALSHTKASAPAPPSIPPESFLSLANSDDTEGSADALSHAEASDARASSIPLKSFLSLTDSDDTESSADELSIRDPSRRAAPPPQGLTMASDPSPAFVDVGLSREKTLLTPPSALSESPLPLDNTQRPSPAAESPTWNPTKRAEPYPEGLTKEYWKKMKGRRANLVKTGLGLALENLHRSYEAIAWEKIRPTPPNAFTLAEWKTQIDEARAESEKISKVVEAGEAVLSTANVARDLLRNNKFSPSRVSETCERIIGVAEELMKSCNQAYIDAQLTELHKSKLASPQLTLNLLHTEVPELVEHCMKLLGGIQTEEGWRNKSMMSQLRRITQLLGNASKLKNRGFDVRVNVERCETIFNELESYVKHERPGLIEKDENPFEFHLQNVSKILRDMLETPIKA